MKHPARLWTRCCGAVSKCLEVALSPALVWSLSASSAIVRPGLLIVLLIVLAPVCLTLTQSRLHASGPITVYNTSDPASTSGNGFCTLREAIDNANARSDTSGGDCAPGTGADEIQFAVAGTITLNSSLPSVANSLTIQGSGQAIDGASSSQIFSVDSNAFLQLNNLTIQNGKGSVGGGAANNGGTLTIVDCIFTGNNGQNGAGAIVDNGILNISDSTFENNSATLNGGAIRIDSGIVSIAGSTFSNNQAPRFGSGGAIYNDGTLTITNSTLYNNYAADYGGGVYNGGTLTIKNGTVQNNSTDPSSAAFEAGVAGSGIYGNLTAENTLLGDNPGGNCQGTVTDDGYNI